MPKTETEVQNEILLEMSKRGAVLWRNNVGVAFRKDGVPIRYGLANVSKKMNSFLKSSDLIGITPVKITPKMVGLTVGVFTAIECKKEDWEFKGTEREVAQQSYIDLVKKKNGFATFCNNVEDL